MDTHCTRAPEKPENEAVLPADAEHENDRPAAEQAPCRPKHRFGLALYLAWCKRCGICGEFCRTGAIVNDEMGTPVIVDEDRCGGCMQCMYRCPDFCVEVFEKTGCEDAATPCGGPAARKDNAA